MASPAGPGDTLWGAGAKALAGRDALLQPPQPGGVGGALPSPIPWVLASFLHQGCVLLSWGFLSDWRFRGNKGPDSCAAQFIQDPRGKPGKILHCQPLLWGHPVGQIPLWCPALLGAGRVGSQPGFKEQLLLQRVSDLTHAALSLSLSTPPHPLHECTFWPVLHPSFLLFVYLFAQQILPNTSSVPICTVVTLIEIKNSVF